MQVVSSETVIGPTLDEYLQARASSGWEAGSRSLVMDESLREAALLRAPDFHYVDGYTWICQIQYDVDSISKCKGGRLQMWNSSNVMVANVFVPLPTAPELPVTWQCLVSIGSFVITAIGGPVAWGGKILMSAAYLFSGLGILGSCP